MANPTDVLFQLQTRLDTLDKLRRVKVNQEEDLEEDIGGDGSSGAGFGTSLANRYSRDAGDIDADNADAVDEPYTTHRPIQSANDEEVDDDKIKVEQALMQIFREAPEDEVPAEEPPAEEAPAEAPPEEAPAEEAPPEGAEGEMPPEGAEGEMPPEGGMEGMGEEQEVKSPSEIGRIYELKKIYTRLTTIESYLSDSSDPDLLRIKLLVSKAIELFEILSANIPTYQPPKAPKERIDEIIVMYYKFIKQIYESVAKHYKSQNEKLRNDNLTKSKITIDDKELV
jgi:hypothetical protein